MQVHTPRKHDHTRPRACMYGHTSADDGRTAPPPKQRTVARQALGTQLPLLETRCLAETSSRARCSTHAPAMKRTCTRRGDKTAQRGQRHFNRVWLHCRVGSQAIPKRTVCVACRGGNATAAQCCVCDEAAADRRHLPPGCLPFHGNRRCSSTSC